MRFTHIVEQNNYHPQSSKDCRILIVAASRQLFAKINVCKGVTKLENEKLRGTTKVEEISGM